MRVGASVWQACAGAVLATVVGLAFWPPSRIVQTLTGATASSSRDIARLVDAVGDRRLVEGRLTGGFHYGPPESATRSATTAAAGSPARSNYRLTTLSAEIAEKAAGDESPAVTHALGVALLLQHESESAIRVLEQAARADARNPEFQVDLAVAYLSQGDQFDHSLDALRALDAIDVALALRPQLPEAWYNRALVLQHLGLTDAAATSRREFLRLDTSSAWSASMRDEEAKAAAATHDSMDCSRVPQQLTGSLTQDEATALVTACAQTVREYLEWEAIPAWAEAVSANNGSAQPLAARARMIADAIAHVHGDRLPQAGVQTIIAATTTRNRLEPLAAGHRELALGRRLYDSDRRDEAFAHLTRASSLLRDARSPYWLWAEQYLARVDSHHRRSREALARLDIIRRAALPASYSSLLARAAWLRGLVLFQSSDPGAALESYRESVAYYEQLHETENASNVFNTSADTHRIVGEIESGWGVLASAMANVSRLGDPTRRYLICYNASLYALRLGLDRAALAFQDEAVRHARARSGPGGLVEALLNRSKIHAKLRNEQKSREDMQEALSLLSRVTDEQQHRYMLARYQAVQAELDATVRPQQALSDAQQAREYFAIAEPGELPKLHWVSARAAVQQGNPQLADEQLRTGIAAFEQRRLRLQDELARAAYFDEGWDLYAELIGLRVNAGRADAAFEVAEQSKAMSLLDRLPAAAALPASPVQLAARIPRGTVVVTFAQHGHAMHWWRLAGGRVTDGVLSMSADALAAAVLQLRQTLRDETPGSTARVHRQLEDLYRVLIQPLALDDSSEALAWIPDGSLQDLPIAALRNPATGRFLIEDREIIVAPSVRIFVAASDATVARDTEGPDGTDGTGGADRTGRTVIIGDPSFNRDVFPHVPPLKGARREAEEISRIYPEALTLAGAQATRRRVLEALPTADIVHVAGHAIGNETAPQMSQLLLAPEPGVDPVGALYGYELGAMRLNARLVMLAACRTASGRAHPGEGAMSLARFLLGSGVTTVVGTLWDVDDAVSRDVSIQFHQAFKATRRAAGSLRAAQRAAIGRYPVSWWAAFIVYGGLTARDH